MERVTNAAFGPTDRIGQLTLRNLDIADSRSRLEQYVSMGLLGVGAAAQAPATGSVADGGSVLDGVEEPSRLGLATTSLVGDLTPGGADRIASGVGPTEDEEESLDWAAMEFGTD